MGRSCGVLMAGSQGRAHSPWSMLSVWEVETGSRFVQSTDRALGPTRWVSFPEVASGSVIPGCWGWLHPEAGQECTVLFSLNYLGSR